MRNDFRDRRWPFREVTIVNTMTSSGARMGGLSPDADLTSIGEHHKYFITIPIKIVLELSIFIKCNFELYWENKGKIQQGDDPEGMVQLLCHNTSNRRTIKTSHCNYLSPLGLNIGKLKIDSSSFDDAWPGHKIDGFPCCPERRIADSVSSLLSSGYSLILQLNFPSAEDCDIDLNWPFTDGSFYLFSNDEGHCFLWT